MMEWYMRGVEVLRQWIQDGKGGAERGLEGKLCSALCAMAEIYMSDLWCVFFLSFLFTAEGGRGGGLTG